MKNTDNFIQKVNAEITALLFKGGKELENLFHDGSIYQGKRLRAKIFHVFSQSHNNSAVKLAAVIELVHAATLIHDDIIDRSLIRRGKPVLHSQNSITSAVLYGDYLFSSAFNALSEIDSPEIFRRLTEALALTLKGEILEHSRKRDSKLSIGEYFSIIEQKSGTLFGVSGQLGAILKGEDTENTERARSFGINAGIAYQLTDDYLDYFGKCEGKEKFKDIREGVVTLPLILLMDKGKPEDRKKAANALANASLSVREAEETSFLMEAAGIPALVLREIEKLQETALKNAPEYALDMLRENFKTLNPVNGSRKSVS